jgi:GNAT superfamily N-acetyltransferase
MVRAGDANDIYEIVRMADRFWHHTIYDETFCPNTVSSMAKACIDQRLMSVLEVDGKLVGFACGVVGALLGNASIKSGTEIAWWVEPEHRSGGNGIKLLKHIEELARKTGIKYWNMAYMESSMPEQIKGIYEKLGYKRTEIIYSREL